MNELHCPTCGLPVKLAENIKVYVEIIDEDQLDDEGDATTIDVQEECALYVCDNKHRFVLTEEG